MTIKIIPLPDTFFLKRVKKPPLSKRMIDSLLEACAKQHAGVLFGPKDIKGSFMSLISRGLIVMSGKNMDNDDKPLWQVTKEAIVMLHALGIETDC